MISSLKRLIVGTAAVIGLASSANAAFVPATWTDTIGGATYIQAGTSHSYTHYITDAASGGFRPGVDDVQSFSLSIDLFDDGDDWFLEFERAEINVGGGDWEERLWSWEFGNDAYTGSFTGSAFASLDNLGRLSVTVTAMCTVFVCSDFVLGTSTLVANGLRQVPEPGTIALLGLGLLGIGLGRRKAAK